MKIAPDEIRGKTITHNPAVLLERRESSPEFQFPCAGAQSFAVAPATEGRQTTLIPATPQQSPPPP